MNKDFSGIFKFKVKKSSKTAAKKGSKSNSIFTSMSVAHVDDEDLAATKSSPGPGEAYRSEKVFDNGDFYTGQWVDNLPHGHGKYLWNDGCMYVGEWQKGKTMGKGRFTWPSGATYEGEFKRGYMDGKGTYTSSNEDIYRGYWSMNLKHGEGTETYANGDFYEGEWKNGIQDGEGRYQWINGNCYVGKWKDGTFHGNGTLKFANGYKFEGCWKGGYPEGEGTYTWADGSCYVGVWSIEPSEQNVVYYGASSSSDTGDGDWDPEQFYTVDLNECKINRGEEITVFPSHKMVYCLNFSRKSERKSTENKGDSWSSEEDGSNHRYVSRSFRPMLLPKTIKKQGVTICRGHKNYELMLNLQLGIRSLYFRNLLFNS